ncbi:DnaJ family domain-containing protein [Roseobacter fucihabitans]|nr:DnaJ family domain-containing protein [Roseobacter litoralis]
MRSLRNLVERQIAKAQTCGAMDGLEGEGKPLPDRRV